MPRKIFRGSRTLRGKRRGRRRFNNNNNFNNQNGNRIAILNSTRLCIADRARVKLGFSDILVVTAGATEGEYVWRANGMFDPGVTGGTAQPVGFDQWSAFYQRYRVLHFSYKFVFTNPSTASPLTITVLPSMISTGGANIISAMSLPYAKFTTVGIATGTSVRQITGSFSIKQIVGQPVNIEEAYSALVTASPSAQCYLSVQFASTDLTTSAVLQIQYEFIYTGVFYYRQVLDISEKPPNPFIYRHPGKGCVSLRYNNHLKKSEMVNSPLHNSPRVDQKEEFKEMEHSPLFDALILDKASI